MCFVEKFEMRGAAIKTAYTAPESKVTRPFAGHNLLVDVMIDLIHRAKLAGLDAEALFESAQTGAAYEWEMVGDDLTEARQQPRAAA